MIEFHALIFWPLSKVRFVDLGLVKYGHYRVAQRVQVYHVIILNTRATSVIRSPIMFGYFVKLVSVILSFLAVHSLVVKHCQIFHQKPVRVLSMDLFVNSKPREWSFHIFASLLFFKNKRQKLAT